MAGLGDDRGHAEKLGGRRHAAGPATGDDRRQEHEGRCRPDDKGRLAAFAFAGMPERGHVRQTVWALTVLVWLGALSWSVYEVVLTRSLRADNAWALPDGAVVGLATFLAAVLALVDRSQLKPGKRYGPDVTMIVLGATTVGLVTWAGPAPCPSKEPSPSHPPTPARR